MPYHVEDDNADCSGYAVVKDSDGTIMGCHRTRAEALDQLAALHIAEPDLRAVDLSAPEFMRANARRGLKLYEAGLGGDGLVPRTIADARRMAAGSISEAKWRKIAPWIARHLVDLDAVEGDEVTAGVVAHYLWGSGRTKAAARRTMNYAQDIIDRLDAEERVARLQAQLASTVVADFDRLGVGDMKEARELPPSYRPADSADVPVMRPACGTCEYMCIMLDEMGEPVTHCKRWDAVVAVDGYCDAYEPREEEEDKPMMGEMETDALPENMIPKEPVSVDDAMGAQFMDFPRSVEWLHVDKDERRSVVYSTLEVRAAGDGNTLVGYAAVFDSPSVDMGFTEYVTRGAFTKTLKDGADVRLLVDHEGIPLARTKAGTLRLTEDDRGLRVEADLDPTNPLANTVLSALRRGDMNQMSFAFRTIRDNWSTDRTVRELREVQLFDVSVVTFPAYESTVAEVRAQQHAKVATGRTKLRAAQVKIAQAKN